MEAASAKWDRDWDKRTQLLICIPAIFVLFLPKINLISVGKETAGVRIDDVILLILLALVLLLRLLPGKRITQVEKLIYCIVGLGLLSVVWNWILYWHGQQTLLANPLYVIRLLEYFTFFFIGWYVVSWIRITSILSIFLLVNTVLVVFQAAGWIGAFTHNNYVSNVAAAPPGLTAGHWELGFIVSLVTCVFIFRHKAPSTRLVTSSGYSLFPVSQSIPLFWIALAVLLQAVIGSRSGILSLILVLLVKVLSSCKRPAFACLILVLSSLAVLVPLSYSSNFTNLSIIERSQKLFSTSNIHIIGQVFSHIDTDTYTLNEAYGEVDPNLSESHDLSWLIRLHKWCYAMVYFLKHPESYLLGIGPGCCKSALDGGILRIIVEFGLLGSAAFFYWLYVACRPALVLKMMVVVFFVNMIFLDTYLAYKAMSVFMLTLGAIHRLLRVTPKDTPKLQSEAYRLLGRRA